MELLPPEIRRLLCERYPIGSQDGQSDAAKVIVKLFFPAGRYSSTSLRAKTSATT